MPFLSRPGLFKSPFLSDTVGLQNLFQTSEKMCKSRYSWNTSGKKTERILDTILFTHAILLSSDVSQTGPQETTWSLWGGPQPGAPQTRNGCARMILICVPGTGKTVADANDAIVIGGETSPSTPFLHHKNHSTAWSKHSRRIIECETTIHSTQPSKDSAVDHVPWLVEVGYA